MVVPLSAMSPLLLLLLVLLMLLLIGSASCWPSVSCMTARSQTETRWSRMDGACDGRSAWIRRVGQCVRVSVSMHVTRLYGHPVLQSFGTSFLLVNQRVALTY